MIRAAFRCAGPQRTVAQPRTALTIRLLAASSHKLPRAAIDSLRRRCFGQRVLALRLDITSPTLKSHAQPFPAPIGTLLPLLSPANPFET